ncbi:MAG: hypothetical protein ACLGGX_10810 [Bdellovibrionia bacterium]
MKKAALQSAELIYTFQNLPLSISERTLAIALDKCRNDPRLMEVCTEFVRDFWWNLQPKILNSFIKRAKHPFMIRAVTTVILDHCQLPIESKKQFLDWVTISCRAISLPPPQLLYVGIIPVASKSMQNEIESALPSFRKCNLISKDLPFNKGQTGSIKSANTLIGYKLSNIELLKNSLAMTIKNYKAEGLTNDQLIKRTGINRVFLSKILNNELEGISIEYLAQHTELNNPTAND